MKQLNQNSNKLCSRRKIRLKRCSCSRFREGDPTIFYDIVEYFTERNVSPVYSVVENPEVKEPFITVSLLYSRKPAELVNDFNKIAEKHAQAKVQKSLDQYVALEKLNVNLEDEAKQAVKQRGEEEEILAILKRLGKL